MVVGMAGLPIERSGPRAEATRLDDQFGTGGRVSGTSARRSNCCGAGALGMRTGALLEPGFPKPFGNAGGWLRRTSVVAADADGADGRPKLAGGAAALPDGAAELPRCSASNVEPGSAFFPAPGSCGGDCPRPKSLVRGATAACESGCDGAL